MIIKTIAAVHAGDSPCVGLSAPGPDLDIQWLTTPAPMEPAQGAASRAPILQPLFHTAQLSRETARHGVSR